MATLAGHRRGEQRRVPGFDMFPADSGSHAVRHRFSTFQPVSAYQQKKAAF